MAFASLFTLLDDISAVLDDVAAMTKLATKKTAGVLGDDLALNANQLTGIRADRELPIVWAVLKGSLVNKLILVPLALLLSAFASWLITPLLMIGGAYLCFEGVEKLLHKFLHKSQAHAETGETEYSVVQEKEKIRGAVRTDFILSAEIIILTLGVVSSLSMPIQIVTLSVIALGVTFFVYGLVGGIVKMDDLGFWLMRKSSKLAQRIGRAIIAFVPWFMRALSFVGTLAMFLVGGGIIAHNLPFLHHFLEAHQWIDGIAGQLATLIIGLISGAFVCLIVLPVMKLFTKSAK